MNFIICFPALILDQSIKNIPLGYRRKPNLLKFHELMNTDDPVLLTKVVIFCKTIVAFLDRIHKYV